MKKKIMFIVLIVLLLVLTLGLLDYMFFNVLLNRPKSTGFSVSGTEFHYEVDATKPETGELYIKLTITNFSEGKWIMYQSAPNSAVEIKDFKVTNPKGDEIKVTEKKGSKAPLRNIYNDKLQDVIINYTAKPGGKVKHGIQGQVNEEFGFFTGEVFMHFYGEVRKEKKNYSGISDVKKVRVKVKTKDDWKVYSSMRETKEGFDPAVNGKWTFSALKYSNIAIGHFDEYEKKFGETNHRVYVSKKWGKEENDIIAKRCYDLYEVFHEQTPFEGLPLYTTIVVPSAVGKAVNPKIMGQVWSTGQGYSYEVYGMDDGVRRRFWELYAHRIAHSINRYGVTGFHTPDKYERWLDEGWASWVEITHAKKAGIITHDRRFDTLWRWYSNVFHGKDKRNVDLPEYMETEVREHNDIRYLHYFKGPLVTNFLDYEMRRLSGGKKDLHGLMHEIYPTYRNHKKAVPLLKEINKYMGDDGDMNYFFDEYVKKTGHLYPLYEGFYEKCREKMNVGNPLKSDVVKKIGNYELQLFQYEELKAFLKSLDKYEDQDIEEIIDEMIITNEEYNKRKLTVIPKEIVDLYPYVPADVQKIMFEHQKYVMFDSKSGYNSWVADQKKSLGN